MLTNPRGKQQPFLLEKWGVIVIWQDSWSSLLPGLQHKQTFNSNAPDCCPKSCKAQNGDQAHLNSLQTKPQLDVQTLFKD
jgi:hypothetical protein